jgi:hypothetical protein
MAPITDSATDLPTETENPCVDSSTLSLGTIEDFLRKKH